MKLKYIGLSVLGMALVLLYFFVNPSELDILPKCPLYVTTGIYCPGCGSQRATHHLLHFNFEEVLQQNVLYFFGLLFIGYYLTITSLNFFLKKNIYNYVYHPKTPLIILIVILLFWIARNLPFYPFNCLAPN
ncbi:MAG: hypothetical protein COC16_05420 [Lutibacter sp.]|nr:MAG: hypothetical protein COC16_05420 [Lutibacter sp.]PHS52538.1 MAG: hypothetical protein COB01_06885 [Lutibacter sp.]